MGNAGCVEGVGGVCGAGGSIVKGEKDNADEGAAELTGCCGGVCCVCGVWGNCVCFANCGDAGEEEAGECAVVVCGGGGGKRVLCVKDGIENCAGA